MNTYNFCCVVTLMGLISLTSVNLAAEGGWTRKANMPTARSGLCACVVDGKIYAIGGAPRNQVVTAVVEQFDPASDTWTTRASMHVPRTFFGAATVNGKIYAIGGWAQGGAYLSSCEEYDPVANSWTTKASMPTNRCFLSAVALNDKIYVLGGGPRVGGNSPSYPTAAVRTVEEYDPATDTWTKKADMPRQAGVPSCSAVGGDIYCAGGGDTPTIGSGTDQAVTKVEAGDPVTGIWMSKAPMLTPRAFFATCVMKGKLYAIGGCIGAYNNTEHSSMEAYDPATDKWWKLAPMQVKRKALASAVVKGKVYALGGVSNAGWEPALSTVEEYDPEPTVSLLRTGSLLKISWNSILQSSDTVDGASWQDFNPAARPYYLDLNQAGFLKFYRSREP